MQPNYLNIFVAIATLIILAVFGYLLITDVYSGYSHNPDNWCHPVDPNPDTDNDKLDRMACADSIDASKQSCCMEKYGIWGGE